MHACVHTRPTGDLFNQPEEASPPLRVMVEAQSVSTSLLHWILPRMSPNRDHLHLVSRKGRKSTGAGLSTQHTAYARMHAHPHADTPIRIHPHTVRLGLHASMWGGRPSHVAAAAELWTRMMVWVMMMATMTVLVVVVAMVVVVGMAVMVMLRCDAHGDAGKQCISPYSRRRCCCCCCCCRCTCLAVRQPGRAPARLCNREACGDAAAVVSCGGHACMCLLPLSFANCTCVHLEVHSAPTTTHLGEHTEEHTIWSTCSPPCT